MAETKRKGDIGEAMVMADVLRRGYKVAIPVGEDWSYDLIVLRDNKLDRIQCKYTESDGSVITVMCQSRNNWNTKKYTSEMIDWLAVYDKITDTCYYISSKLLKKNGQSMLKLRLTPTKNNQRKGILWAKDFLVY